MSESNSINSIQRNENNELNDNKNNNYGRSNGNDRKEKDNMNGSQTMSYAPVRGVTQTTADARFDPLKTNVQAVGLGQQTTASSTVALQQMQSAATKQALANAKQQTLLAQKLKQMNTYTWSGNVTTPTEQQAYGVLPSVGWPVDGDYNAYGLNNLLLPAAGMAASQAFTNPQSTMSINPALAMSLNPLVNPLVNPLMNPFASVLQGAFTAGIPDGKQHALFVFHLPEDIDDHGLLQLFGPYGAIRANVMRQENGRTKGFGFVHFNNRHDASIAIEMMNGHQIGRKRLMVSFKKEKNEHSDPTNNIDIQQSLLKRDEKNV